MIGEGTYGQVVKAKHRKTGQIYAIKLIKDIFHNEQHAKQVCRELKIMRHLSKDEDNIYTVKLHDVIITSTNED